MPQPVLRVLLIEDNPGDKRLGESRKFQKHLAQLTAGIAGAGKDTPAPKAQFPFLSGVLRGATTSVQ